MYMVCIRPYQLCADIPKGDTQNNNEKKKNWEKKSINDIIMKKKSDPCQYEKYLLLTIILSVSG